MYVLYESHYKGEEKSILPEADDVTDPNLLLDAEVILSKKGIEKQVARVMNRTKDKDSNLIGTYNPDPILNTIVYDVMFPDGSVSKYAANLIAENIYSQVDEEGHRYQLLDHISNHSKDYIAVRYSEARIVSKNGRRNRKSTTKG